MTQHSQFALLGKRRFLPFFITQLLGAFNDNIFKQSLILAILYHLSVSGDRSLLVNLCALLFILPFFLFSALGGQFGEKYNKDALMRALKLAEVGIMLVGAAGFVFGILLWWHAGGIPPGEVPYDWLAVLRHHETWAVLADILFIGIFGGFYIVPLYALIQARTDEDKRARVIAANNILNALFMVAAALVSILFLSVAKLSIPQLFLALSLMNVAVNVYIFKIVPEFTMRFLVWLLSHTMYRVRHVNLEAIPDEGAAVLVCNHVSYVDALLIAGSIRRPVRFVMYYRIFSLPVLNFVFRTAGAVPIAARHEDEGIYERAFQRIADYLRDGELVCIFPEGKLTADGEMNEFRAGIERIIEETPVPVIPMALQGLWGSFFSRDPNKGFFRRLWSRVSLVAGESVAPGAVERLDLQARVTSLRGEAR